MVPQNPYYMVPSIFKFPFEVNFALISALFKGEACSEISNEMSEYHV